MVASATLKILGFMTPHFGSQVYILIIQALMMTLRLNSSYLGVILRDWL